MTKLTAPQRKALLTAREDDSVPGYGHGHLTPLQALESAGLVETRSGHGWREFWLTDAGRELVTELRKQS